MTDEKDFDFTSLFGASFHPELKILVNVATEQLEKGVQMEKVLVDSLEFAVSNANLYHTDLICKANEQIANGLRELAFKGAWPNLGKVADHALELEGVELRKDPRLKDIARLCDLRKRVLRTSMSELMNVFKKDWLEENFPELVIHSLED